MVLTTNQVSLWHALKIMDRKALGGLGVLLREHLTPIASIHVYFRGKADIPNIHLTPFRQPF